MQRTPVPQRGSSGGGDASAALCRHEEVCALSSSGIPSSPSQGDPMGESVVLGITGLVVGAIAGMLFFVMVKSILDERRSSRPQDMVQLRTLDRVRLAVPDLVGGASRRGMASTDKSNRRMGSPRGSPTTSCSSAVHVGELAIRVPAAVRLRRLLSDLDPSRQRGV